MKIIKKFRDLSVTAIWRVKLIFIYETFCLYSSPVDGAATIGIATTFMEVLGNAFSPFLVTSYHLLPERKENQLVDIAIELGSLTQ